MILDKAIRACYSTQSQLTEQLFTVIDYLYSNRNRILNADSADYQAFEDAIEREDDC